MNYYVLFAIPFIVFILCVLFQNLQNVLPISHYRLINSVALLLLIPPKYALLYDESRYLVICYQRRSDLDS